jgi:hypothetical protein
MDRRTKCIFSRAAFGGATFSTRNFHHDTVSKWCGVTIYSCGT